MACACDTSSLGNPVYGIPVKVGEPLSTACERATVTGQIPEVVRGPGFTLVGGAPVVGVTSNGGIESMSCFFASRKGCYYNMNARPYGTTCA